MHFVNKAVRWCASGSVVALACGGLVACAPADRDLDGIPDKLDECPVATEDFDNFDDTDGCPDLDNDKDAVPDMKDKCPLDAEDRDGFQDADGCPDLDNDQDGIPDLKDKCPDQPEDRDGFEDADGCPDLDNDQDGVADELDKCSNDQEDLDGFEDADGCPELDNDKDGIPDLKDKCPNDRETVNGKDDEDGCPDQDVEALDDEISLPLRFETGTANLTFEDRTMIEQSLVAGLKAFSGHRVYVYVFMPLLDVEETEYLDLLNARSQAVGAFLESAGVKREQIKIRTVTPELLAANKGTAEDFQTARPVIFRIKK